MLEIQRILLPEKCSNKPNGGELDDFGTQGGNRQSEDRPNGFQQRSEPEEMSLGHVVVGANAEREQIEHHLESEWKHRRAGCDERLR